jgi:hypothetical protein
MAFRLHDYVVRGEIDNRVRGQVSGKIWFFGRTEPVELSLEGNPWRDLAGCRLEFINPEPKLGIDECFSRVQSGVVGDITASRKNRVPEVSLDEMLRLAEAGRSYPWHWANTFYFEWFSRNNGRVIIESTSYKLLVSTHSWTMSLEEEQGQFKENALQTLGCLAHLHGVMEADQKRKSMSLSPKKDR